MRDNPLFKVLKASQGVEMGPPKRMTMDMPRMVEFDLKEIGPASKPGDEVTVYVYGTIKSVNDEGKAMVNISKVEGNDGEERGEAEESKIVTTQESHVP